MALAETPNGPSETIDLWKSWWKCEIRGLITDPRTLAFLSDTCMVRLDPSSFSIGMTVFEADAGDTDTEAIKGFLGQLRQLNPGVRIVLWIEKTPVELNDQSWN